MLKYLSIPIILLRNSLSPLKKGKSESRKCCLGLQEGLAKAQENLRDIINTTRYPQNKYRLIWGHDTILHRLHYLKKGHTQQ